MNAPVAVAAVLVPAPQQSLFLYGLVSLVFVPYGDPCLALALWLSIIPWIGAILAVAGSGIAIIVSVNIAGQFAVIRAATITRPVPGYAILMLISCFLSVWFIYVATYVTTWCATNADDHNSEIHEVCGIAGAMAAFSIITAFFRLVTTAILDPVLLLRLDRHTEARGSSGCPGCVGVKTHTRSRAMSLFARGGKAACGITRLPRRSLKQPIIPASPFGQGTPNKSFCRSY